MDRGPTHRGAERPAVDARLVMPETRYEVHDGKVVYVAPADEPHGTRHSELAFLLEAHLASGYDAAIDMLTRTSETNDFAPDASVFPVARDPRTGGRQLEELAFEVVSTSALNEAGTKAARLRERGVRRVFAMDVKRGRVLEWSDDLGTWQILGQESTIVDRVFATPLPVGALAGTVQADEAVVAALLARKLPALEAALGREREEGRRGLILHMIERKFGPLDAQRERRLREADAAALERYADRLLSAASLAELFAD